MAMPSASSPRTTPSHSLLHNFHVNAKAFLKGDGTTESASAITALQAVAANHHVHWPAGDYKFPDGVGFVLADYMHHSGAVHRKTTISVSDAYAFYSTTNLTDVKIHDFFVQVRPTATTGGAVKSASAGSPNSNWEIRNIYCDNGGAQSNVTTPLFHTQCWIGCSIQDCQAQYGTIGFHLESVSFNNLNQVIRCNGVAQSVAGLKLSTAIGTTIDGCDYESNTGYGIWMEGECFGCVVRSNWFESNTSHDIFINATGHGNQIFGNTFHGTGDVTQNHIKVTTAAVATKASHSILGNEFRDLAGSGVNIALDANTTHCVIMGNRGASVLNGTITYLNGVNVVANNDNTTNSMDMNQFPGGNLNRYGLSSASTDWTELCGDNVNAPILRHFRGSSSTTYPRIILTNNFTAEAGDNAGLVLAKRGDSTDALQQGGAIYGNTNSLNLAAAAGAGMKTLAYINASSSTFATTANATKLGFRGATPVVVSAAYTASNVTPDRAYDANATSTDELADVLGTLIADLKLQGLIG